MNQMSCPKTGLSRRGFMIGIGGLTFAVALRRRGGRPFVGSPASNRGHIVARFARQRAVAAKPRAYSPRTGIVGGRGESEVAKPVPQFAEITRRVTQRLNRIERVRESVPIGRARHKLGDTLGTLGTHCAGIETTFLPDHPCEKLDWKSVLGRRLLQRPANVVGGGWMRQRGLRCVWLGRLRCLTKLGCRRGGGRLRIGLCTC
jgi:hypothetical protein